MTSITNLLDQKNTFAENAIRNLPIEVVVSVGKARPDIKELLELDPRSILTLDREVDSLVDLMVGDRCIAKGRLEEITGEDGNNHLGVRLVEIMMQKL